MSILDSNHRAFLEHELAQVEEQMTTLQATRSYLRQRLGLPEDDGQGDATASAAATNSALLGGDLVSLVNPGQYGGMSANKAAAALLEMVGRNRPLTTREIYDAIKKGGAAPKDTDVLNKMMKRSGRFHRPVPGRWGLAEWYPASARARSARGDDLSTDENGDAETLEDLETPENESE